MATYARLRFFLVSRELCPPRHIPSFFLEACGFSTEFSSHVSALFVRELQSDKCNPKVTVFVILVRVSLILNFASRSPAFLFKILTTFPSSFLGRISFRRTRFGACRPEDVGQKPEAIVLFQFSLPAFSVLGVFGTRRFCF